MSWNLFPLTHNVMFLLRSPLVDIQFQDWNFLPIIQVWAKVLRTTIYFFCRWNFFLLVISIAPEFSSNTQNFTLASVEFPGIPIETIFSKKLVIRIASQKEIDITVFSTYVPENVILPYIWDLFSIGHPEYFTMYPWREKAVSLWFDSFWSHYPENYESTTSWRSLVR